MGARGGGVNAHLTGGMQIFLDGYTGALLRG